MPTKTAIPRGRGTRKKITMDGDFPDISN